MSLPKKRHYPPKKPKVGCLVWCVILGIALLATLFWVGSRNAVDENSPDFKLGHEMGFVVGKADFYDGRERDGLKAKRMGDKTAKANGAQSVRVYSHGFHQGYNDGWHAAKSVSR